MKQAMKWLAAAVILAAVFCCGAAFASDGGACGADVQWALDDQGALTISGTGAMWDYDNTDIPKTPWFGVRGTITSVTVGEGVSAIGEQAFQGCTALTDVSIAGTVTSIGKYAFSGCRSLTAVSLPGSVLSIGYGAFSGCRSLAAVALPQNLLSFDSYAFAGCSGLTEIAIPDSMTDFGEEVFDDYDQVHFVLNSCGTAAYRYFSRFASWTVLHHQQIVDDPAVAPGCVTAGLTAGSHCAACGEVFAVQEPLSPLGHLPAEDEATAATCTLPGLTAGSHCERCGAVLTAQTEIPALGHDWSSEITYTWFADHRTVTASRVCSRDASHVDAVTVEARRTLTLAPTQTQSGAYDLVAVFDGAIYTEQRMEGGTIPALGAMNVLWLPEGLSAIADEAFYGTAFEAVIVPDSCTEIGRQAFAHCPYLLYVSLPAGMTGVDPDAFEHSDSAVLSERQ